MVTPETGALTHTVGVVGSARWHGGHAALFSVYFVERLERHNNFLFCELIGPWRKGNSVE